MLLDMNRCYRIDAELRGAMKRYLWSTFSHFVHTLNCLFIYVGLPLKMGENRTEDVKEKAFRWCRKSLGGAWNQISKEDLQIKPIRYIFYSLMFP